MKQSVAISVDLGATNVRVALINARGHIVQKIKEATPSNGKDGSIVANQIIHMIEQLLARRPSLQIKGVGISSIGPLDYERGGVVNSPNVNFWFIPLLNPLKTHFRVSTVLLNDCNAAVLGEWYAGAGKKMRHLLYITLSTGIGGGAIVDGKLVFGKTGNAAEIGHMVIDTHYRLQCTCGKGIGHWEGYASGRNIPKFFWQWLASKGKDMDATLRDASSLFQAARGGNTDARDFLQELALVNARGISNAIVAYDPQLITIGGSVALKNPREVIYAARPFVDRYLRLPRISKTPLGEDITLIGAAMAVLHGIP